MGRRTRRRDGVPCRRSAMPPCRPTRSSPGAGGHRKRGSSRRPARSRRAAARGARRRRDREALGRHEPRGQHAQGADLHLQDERVARAGGEVGLDLGVVLLPALPRSDGEGGMTHGQPDAVERSPWAPLGPAPRGSVPAQPRARSERAVRQTDLDADVDDGLRDEVDDVARRVGVLRDRGLHVIALMERVELVAEVGDALEHEPPVRARRGGPARPPPPQLALDRGLRDLAEVRVLVRAPARRTHAEPEPERVPVGQRRDHAPGDRGAGRVPHRAGERARARGPPFRVRDAALELGLGLGGDGFDLPGPPLRSIGRRRRAVPGRRHVGPGRAGGGLAGGPDHGAQEHAEDEHRAEDRDPHGAPVYGPRSPLTPRTGARYLIR